MTITKIVFPTFGNIGASCTLFSDVYPDGVIWNRSDALNMFTAQAAALNAVGVAEGEGATNFLQAVLDSSGNITVSLRFITRLTMIVDGILPDNSGDTNLDGGFVIASQFLNQSFSTMDLIVPPLNNAGTAVNRLLFFVPKRQATFAADWDVTCPSYPGISLITNLVATDNGDGRWKVSLTLIVVNGGGFWGTITDQSIVFTTH